MIRKINNQEIDIINNFTNYKVTINPFSNIYVYEENNEIQGFIDYNNLMDIIDLNYIYVLEKYRKNKIATKLLGVMLKENLPITLEVNVNNESAINLYKKNNFEIINIRKNYYKNEDAYLMKRN